MPHSRFKGVWVYAQFPRESGCHDVSEHVRAKALVVFAPVSRDSVFDKGVGNCLEMAKSCVSAEVSEKAPKIRWVHPSTQRVRRYRGIRPLFFPNRLKYIRCAVFHSSKVFHNSPSMAIHVELDLVLGLRKVISFEN